MLPRIFFYCVLLETVIFSVGGVDDCANVPFCRDLRQYTTDDDDAYTADIETSELRDGIGYVNLGNKIGDRLVLEVSALSDNTFRIIIIEENSTRYHLRDVLDGDPETAPLNYIYHDDAMLDFAEEENSLYHVMVKVSPLEIHFHKGEDVPLVLRGSRLILQNTETSQAFAFEANFEYAEYLYGLHEHCDSLALRSTGPGGLDPYRLKNLEAALYPVNSTKAMYGSVPVMYGHGVSATTGIFLHNAAQQWIEITTVGEKPAAYWMAESGVLDLFILQGPTPKDAVRQYTKLTGKPHLPQLWALGYHQCRYSYETSEEVKNVVANFDNHNFPLDAIWLDIDFSDGKRYFRFDPVNYVNPLEMQSNVSSTGRNIVAINDPHIKIDDQYSVYSGALEKDLFVKNPDGSVFQGDCWPGASSWMDFFNPDARAYYASMFSYENFKDTTETMAGFWNDMNEPSVFTGSETTFPGEVVHFGGATNRDVHNMYGFMQTMSTHAGLIQRDNGTKRPFVLSRSHFAGTQRYSAVWTGDNQATWDYLAYSIPQCLTANLAGIVFCGADVAGFLKDPDDELYMRWYQAGIWLPFFRAHSEYSANRREPYLFSEDVQNVVRDAMRLRYRFIPIWYTLFYEHTITGEPLIRPLFYQYPLDSNVFAIDDEFLLGENILVHPIVKAAASTVQTYFPGEQMWYTLDGETVYQGPSIEIIDVDINSIPVFIKAGSALFTNDEARKCTADMMDDDYVVQFYLDESGAASGKVYFDDFTSFKYRDNGEFTILEISFEDFKVIFKKVDGNIPARLPIKQILVHGLIEHKGTTSKSIVEYTTTRDGFAFRDLSWDGKDEIIVYL